MKVLHLTRDLPPHATGGISIAVGGLIRAAREAGIENAAISFDGWRPHRHGGEALEVQTTQFAGAPVWRVTAPSQTAAAIDAATRWQPQLVHVHHGMLWQAAESFAVPRCFTTHVLQRELSRLRGLENETMSLQGQEAALAAADAVICPSAAVLRALSGDGPQLASRLVQIGFGVSCHPLPRTGSDLPMVLYVGRFADVKGASELRRVTTRLLHSYGNARVCIAGGNPESPKSQRRWLRRLHEDLGDAQRARVDFKGWIAPEQLASLRSAATLQLVPSWFETFGLAAAEAMAAGVPVVATTGGALPELIAHGRTGLLAPVKDVDTLVQHASRLINEPQLASEIGRAAAAEVAALHSWSATAEKHRELYARLAG